MNYSMQTSNKEYFFILILPRPKADTYDDIKFTDPKEICPKCIKTKEENSKIIKVFKFDHKIIEDNNKIEFKFSFDGKDYKLTLDNIKGKTFIFESTLYQKNGIFGNDQKIEKKVSLSEKMNHFIDALNTQKESNKFDELFSDSINLCSKTPSFHFLINIFVHVYNTKYCSQILEVFIKNIDKKGQKDDINQDVLKQYKFDFDQIHENSKEAITKYSLNKIDFYGLILCYLNNCRIEKYKELFDELYKNEKSILFDILLKYKLYFKNQISFSEDILNEIIKFCASKDFKTFKESGLYYLKDTNIFLEITENNKEEIIKIKDFSPIEIPKVGDEEKIDFDKIKSKIESITNFSKEKKVLLIIFKNYFWESLAKKSYGISKENIALNISLKKLLTEYHNVVVGLFENEKDNKLKKEIGNFKQRGVFTSQIDRIMKEYIKNKNVTNMEILELIKDNVYYFENKYISKREPDIILSKIDLEEKNEEFIQKFREMKFEKMFEKDLDNFCVIITNKIKTINDYNIILKLVDIDALGNSKSKYIKLLKDKYKGAIQETELSETDDNVINNLASLTLFICTNEEKIEFLEKNISESNIIDEGIKHKIYIKLINFCKEQKNEQIMKFIMLQYSFPLKSENLKNFIDFLQNLAEKDSNDFINNMDNKYFIIETDFYSSGKNLNIELFNLIMETIKLKDDNKYIKNNYNTLKQIEKDINEKKIKFEYLKNFSKDKKEIVFEKLNSLTIIPDLNVDQDIIYENIIKYYQIMTDTLTKLANYKKSLEIYHQEIKKEEISNINSNIETIQKETYNSFYKRKYDIQTLLNESEEIVKKVDSVKDSNIFKIFYNKIDKNDKTKFDIAYTEFEKFKELLIKKGADIINKGSSQSDVINKIKNKYLRDIKIQNELSSYISGEKKNDEEFMLILNDKNFEKDLNSMVYFLSYFSHNSEDAFKELKKLEEKCKVFSKKNKETKEIKKILEELENEGLYNYRENKNIDKKSNYITLFHLFYEKEQALDFLDKYTSEDVKHLYDKIEPNRGTLKINDISITKDCVGFFQELKEIKGGLKQIISQIKKKLDLPSALDRFKKYSEIYREVIELNQNFDFSLNVYEEIKGIISKAKIIFNKNNDEIDINDQTITIDKIKELKNKIRLNQRGKSNMNVSENSKKYEEKCVKLKFFSDLSYNIEEIHDSMNILRKKGSTLPISIRVEIAYPEVKYFLGKDNIEKEFKEIQKFLASAKANINNKLNSIYVQMTTIRFIYGRQIDSLLSHIQGEFPINSFLRYILNLTNSKIEVKEGDKAFDRKTKDYINEIEKYNSDSFDFIQNYIISLFKKNGTSIEDHYKNISIKNTKDLKGLYTYISELDSMEEDILQIFLDKIGKIPIAQNILISSKETSYEEMQAFFNRAILCKYNTLFVVEINGSFSDYQLRCMNIFIDKLLTYKNEKYNEKNRDNNKEVEKYDTHLYMDSCLVFIYNKKSESFLNDLKNFKPKNLKMDKTNHSLNRMTTSSQSSFSSSFDPLRQELYNKTHIIQSEICGLGKSTQIKNRIKQSGKKYIYFPLGGNITKDQIYVKLKEIMKDINNKTTNNYEYIAIHLDLFDSKENIVSILNEFLFSFLITKFYSNNENVIHIPTDIEIYIEIPNTFKDFISNYSILKSFKIEEEDDIITIEHLPEFNLPLDKINIFKNMLGMTDNNKIYDWLRKKIKIKRYSYHQIHIFINLFICQYKIFKVKGKKDEYLKIKFSENGNDVTEKCINSFAEATKYFTYGGFSRLLLDEKKKQDKNMDEIDILSEAYENDLKDEKFDKKLIFIVENKNLNRGNDLPDNDNDDSSSDYEAENDNEDGENKDNKYL